jgi:tetratricopeptide (TPR) repeat protein
MHSKGDCDRAIKAFSSCIQLDSSNVRAFIQRGISHECIKNTKAALADYSMAIELLPEDGKAYYLRGMLLWRLCDATAIDDLEKSAELGYRLARDFLRRKVSRSNQSPQQNIERSLQEEAIQVFTESIRSDPTNTNTYLNRGMAYERVDNMLQAIFDYSKAIELAPDCARAYYFRGTILWHLDDNTSIRDLRKAAELGYSPARDFLDQKTLHG